MSKIRRVTAASALSLMFLTAGAGAAAADYGTAVGTVLIGGTQSGTLIVSPGSGTSVVTSGWFTTRSVIVYTRLSDLSMVGVRGAAAATSITCGESASVMPDADGKVNVTIVAPADASGACDVTFSGTGSDGNPSEVSAQITISDSPTAGGTGLPRTGSDSLVLARYGLVLVGVGGLMAVSARRAARLRAAIEA